MPGHVGGGHAYDNEAGAEAARGGRDGDVSEERMPQRYLVQGREASSWSGDHRFLLNTEMSANSVPYDLMSTSTLAAAPAPSPTLWQLPLLITAAPRLNCSLASVL